MIKNDYTIKNNKLIYRNHLIKILEQEEIESARILIEILNNFEYEIIDIDINYKLFSDDQFVKGSYLISEKTKIHDFLIKIFYLREYTNIFKNDNLNKRNLKELLDLILENDLYYYSDIENFINFLDECYQVPDKLQHHINYNSIAETEKINRVITAFKITEKNNDLTICKIIIKTSDGDDFNNNILY